MTDTVERAAVEAAINEWFEGYDSIGDSPHLLGAWRALSRKIRALPSAGGGEDKLREITEQLAQYPCACESYVGGQCQSCRARAALQQEQK